MVVVDVKVDMLVVYEEMFGLLVVFIFFDMEDEVVVVVNDIEFGLVVYFYMCDLGCVWWVFDVLELGMVGVNMGLILIVEVLFGGVK